eukprot:snap_masked-scaffold_29-processed-gene-3.14-mRNA-1 protein AED:1.00 eAED:1.00 QI:0/-1/0/0/-1/1/1/0/79
MAKVNEDYIDYRDFREEGSRREVGMQMIPGSAPEKMLHDRPFIGLYTLITVFGLCFIIGPFSLLFFCCPLDRKTDVIRL